jgi:hypothetical protein
MPRRQKVQAVLLLAAPLLVGCATLLQANVDTHQAALELRF